MNKFSKIFIVVGSIAVAVPIGLMLVAFGLIWINSCSGNFEVEGIVCASDRIERIIGIFFVQGFTLGMILVSPGLLLLLAGKLMKKSNVPQVITAENTNKGKSTKLRKILLEANAPWLCHGDAHKSGIGGGQYFLSKKAWFSSPNAPGLCPGDRTR